MKAGLTTWGHVAVIYGGRNCDFWDTRLEREETTAGGQRSRPSADEVKLRLYLEIDKYRSVGASWSTSEGGLSAPGGFFKVGTGMFMKSYTV